MSNPEAKCELSFPEFSIAFFLDLEINYKFRISLSI